MRSASRLGGRRRDRVVLVLANLVVAVSLLAASASSSAYENWVADRGPSYDHVQWVGDASSEKAVAVHWSVDDDESVLRLAVAANATGWVGFGIAESGGMPGADLVIYTVADDALTDAHALAYAAPTVDRCQDWTLRNSSVVAAGSSSSSSSGFVAFEASRALDTLDSQDRAVSNDADVSTPAHRAIVAWGDQETLSYHATNRATTLLRFYRSTDANDSSSPSLTDHPHHDFRANGYEIPTDTTTYARFCAVVVPTLLTENDVHMVGASFIEDARNVDLVHHIVLYASKETVYGCDASFTEIVYVWAPGSDDLILPPNVGTRFGPNGYHTLMLEIHYDNPSKEAGRVDDSGVRLYYTSTLRRHDSGMFQIGDPKLYLSGREASSSSNSAPFGKWEFDCPGRCTADALQRGGVEEVTVFHELLHMHRAGTRMNVKHYRDGATTPIRESNVDLFDFDQNGCYAVVQEPYTIRPNDRFATTCYYRKSDDGDVVRFGVASEEEMCIGFVWYYPAVPDWDGICGPSDSSADGLLGSLLNFPLSLVGANAKCPSCRSTACGSDATKAEVGRTFGVDPGTCPA